MDCLTATPPMLSAIPFFRIWTKPLWPTWRPAFRWKTTAAGPTGRARAFSAWTPTRTPSTLSPAVVALYTITKTNSRKIVFFLGPGRLLNHNVLGTRPNTLFAEVISDAILLSMPREEFSAWSRPIPP